VTRLSPIFRASYKQILQSAQAHRIWHSLRQQSSVPRSGCEFQKALSPRPTYEMPSFLWRTLRSLGRVRQRPVIGKLRSSEARMSRQLYLIGGVHTTWKLFLTAEKCFDGRASCTPTLRHRINLGCVLAKFGKTEEARSSLPGFAVKYGAREARFQRAAVRRALGPRKRRLARTEYCPNRRNSRFVSYSTLPVRRQTRPWLMSIRVNSTRCDLYQGHCGRPEQCSYLFQRWQWP